MSGRTAIEARQTRNMTWLRRGVTLLALAATWAALSAWGAGLEKIKDLEQARSAAERDYIAAADADDGAPAARKALEDAERVFEDSTRKLDQARADRLAEYSGVDRATIEQWHAAGASWPDIAYDLSVHPSVIGIETIDDRPPPLDGAP